MVRLITNLHFSSSLPNWWNMKIKFHSPILCWLMNTSITTSILTLTLFRILLGTWRDGNFHSIDIMLTIKPILKLWLKFFLKAIASKILSWNKLNLLLYCLLGNSPLNIHLLLTHRFQGWRNLRIFLSLSTRNLYWK